MKNLINLISLLLLIPLFQGQVFAQNQIPNNDFEYWESFGSYEDPIDWNSPNSYTAGIGVITVTKSTDSYSGNYSAKLESRDIIFVGTIPGFLTLGEFEINIATQEYSITGGVPFTGRPSQFTGNFKYSPNSGDQALMAIVLLKHNPGGVPDTIGMGAKIVTNSVSSWTDFSADIMYFSNEEPDTMNILFLSSAQLSPVAGSKLFVDNLGLMFEVNPEITSVEPSNGAQGTNVGITIICENTNFLSGDTDVVFQKGAEEMYPEVIEVINDNEINLILLIPTDAALGFWDILISNTITGEILGEDLFEVTPAAIQHVFLQEGFQFVSTNLIPNEPDMLILLSDVLNDNLDFVRNSSGSMIRKIGPNWVNNIGDWEVEEGYLFKMFNAGSFIILGGPIDPQTPIELQLGFQFISYFPIDPMDALEAFESILNDNLEFIRNSQGQTLRKIGPNWVNGLGDAIPGEGYLVKMIGEGTLVYPN
ncbi:MAG: PCMD domain-containing protein [Bacteroidales bacterium]|nr:PCMD domain-containing protein [Bacteroidales bacterium]